MSEAHEERSLVAGSGENRAALSLARDDTQEKKVAAKMFGVAFADRKGCGTRRL